MRNRRSEGGKLPCLSWAFGPNHRALAHNFGRPPSEEFFGKHESQFERRFGLGKFLSPKKHSRTADVFGGALPPLASPVEPITQVDLDSISLGTVVRSQIALLARNSNCTVEFSNDLL
jgi:hypothetical protein